MRNRNGKARMTKKAKRERWKKNMTGRCRRARVTKTEEGVRKHAPQWRYKNVYQESKSVPGNPRVRFQRRSRVRCKIIANRT